MSGRSPVNDFNGSRSCRHGQTHDDVVAPSIVADRLTPERADLLEASARPHRLLEGSRDQLRWGDVTQVAGGVGLAVRRHEPVDRLMDEAREGLRSVPYRLHFSSASSVRPGSALCSTTLNWLSPETTTVNRRTSSKG